ncbi:hypothetical protein BS78_06G031500 [Paspalum vaginatum]|nr:hypothetical protein BS78_06G031500 [Paspalum vaginatum]
MLKFGQRPACHGLLPTDVTTIFVLPTAPHLPPFRLAAISDGFNDPGRAGGGGGDLAERCRWRSRQWAAKPCLSRVQVQSERN